MRADEHVGRGARPTKVEQRRARGLGGAVVAAAVLAGAAPALAHASFPGSSGFGFAPNTSGGTGLAGSTPPYAASSRPTLFLRVPYEQVEPFNGSDDTTVDVEVIVPAGWSDPACGAAKRQVNDASTNNTNQPGADVAGWTCHVHHEDGRDRIHWTGPQVVSPATAADSAQFFVFSVTTPSPAVQTTYNGTAGTEGFIVDQTYASGAIEHWIPNAAFPGTAPVGSTTTVAGGLARTVAPAVRGQYNPLDPARILDTRIGTGLTGPFGPAQTRELTVVGAGGVPADATTVVMNVTVTGGTAASDLRLWPAGSPVPDSSNLNWVPGQTVPNLVKVMVGAGGAVSIRNQAGDVQVVADVVGYYAASGDLFTGVQPERILDTRADLGLTDAFGPAQTRDLTVGGQAGVPTDATAVVMSVTVTNGTDHSDLRLWPAGVAQPEVSNLNWPAGKEVPNLVAVKLGAAGQVSIRNQQGTVDVVADVLGYFTDSGDQFTSLYPSRILDTRDGTGLTGTFGPAQTRTLTVAGQGGVPADATAVVINVTVTGGTDHSNLRLWPADQPQPETSNLNWATGETNARLVIVKLDGEGDVALRNQQGEVHVIGDVVGYFVAPPVPA